MRYETITVRHGENVGPVDWSHETARDMPPVWREAEQRPDDFVFGEYQRTILAICMYDGWPYWTPRPAIQFVGALGGSEWAFFDSYAVWPDSIVRRDSDSGPQGGDCSQAPGEAPQSGLNASEGIAQPSREPTP